MQEEVYFRAGLWLGCEQMHSGVFQQRCAVLQGWLQLCTSRGCRTGPAALLGFVSKASHRRRGGFMVWCDLQLPVPSAPLSAERGSPLCQGMCLQPVLSDQEGVHSLSGACFTLEVLEK